MRILYSILIYIFKIALKIYSIFNKKAKQINLGQKNLLKKILTETKNKSNIVWFHAASLGEFEQAKYLIVSYKEKNPNHKILLTFFSPSGYNFMKNSDIADWVFYMPYDTLKNAKMFVENINIIKAIFIKSEFWFNYLQHLHINKIPIYFISCKFRKEQYFFKFYGSWFAKQLKKITIIFVQDNESSALLKSININTIISGDSRFDTVIQSSKKEFNNPIIEAFVKNKKVILLGSVYKKDLRLINKNKFFKDFKIIIVPHELSQINFFKSLTNSILLSKASTKNISNYRVLIINKIGILSRLYRYADINYVGGGFNNGIHNILEPAVYNKPVLFGPNFHKFNEAHELIDNNLALSIKDTNEFISAIKYFEYKDITQTSKKYFISKKGASKIIVNKI